MVNQGSIEHAMERHRRNKNIGASEKHSKSAAHPNLPNALTLCTLDLPGRSLSVFVLTAQPFSQLNKAFSVLKMSLSWAGAWDTLYGQGWRDKSELPDA